MTGFGRKIVRRNFPLLRGLCLVAALIAASATLSSCTRVRSNEGAAPSVTVDDDRVPNARMRANSAVILDPSLQSDVQERGFFESIRRFFFGEKRGQGRIAVENQRATYSDTGKMVVEVMLRNRTDGVLQIEGKTQFLDEEGFTVAEDASGWKRVILQPNAVERYSEISKSYNPAGYLVEVREGR